MVSRRPPPRCPASIVVPIRRASPGISRTMAAPMAAISRPPTGTCRTDRSGRRRSARTRGPGTRPRAVGITISHLRLAEVDLEQLQRADVGHDGGWRPRGHAALSVIRRHRLALTVTAPSGLLIARSQVRSLHGPLPRSAYELRLIVGNGASGESTTRTSDATGVPSIATGRRNTGSMSCGPSIRGMLGFTRDEARA